MCSSILLLGNLLRCLSKNSIVFYLNSLEYKQSCLTNPSCALVNSKSSIKKPKLHWKIKKRGTVNQQILCWKDDEITKCNELFFFLSLENGPKLQGVYLLMIKVARFEYHFWFLTTVHNALRVWNLQVCCCLVQRARRRTPKCQKIEDEIVDKARQEFSLKGEPCNFLLLANSRFTPIFECHIMHYTTVVDMSHLSEFKHLQFSWKCHNVNNRWKNLQAKQKKHHPLIM